MDFKISCYCQRAAASQKHGKWLARSPEKSKPFVCVKCEQKVSYPTVSCCPKDIISRNQQHDISEIGRKRAWKVILAKANKLAADAKARLIKTEKAQKAEIRLQQRQRQKQVAVEAASSKPDPFEGLPVFPKCLYGAQKVRHFWGLNFQRTNKE